MEENLALVGRRARLAQRFLMGFLVLAGLSLVSSALQYVLLLGAQRGELITDAAANANDLRELAVGILVMLALIANAVVFLRWKVAAYRLVPDLTGQDTDHTSGWAAGAYFVPILNLFRPYQIMKEIWESGTSPRDELYLETEPSSAALLGAWWAGWLLYGFAGRINWHVTKDAVTVEDFLAVTQFDIGFAVATAGVTALAILVVQRVNQRQQERGAFAQASILSEPSSAVEYGVGEAFHAGTEAGE